MSNIYNTKFLIVDDFATSRKLVLNILYEIGFNNVVQAGDGASAFQILTEYYNNNDPFGFIISDWNMPDMTGIEFLKKCRKEKKFSNLPFLMLTVESDTEKVFEAKSEGSTDYLIKPVVPEILRHRIMKYLNPPEKIDFLKAGILKKRR